MGIFTPPMNIALRDRRKATIFLAGTIDQGNSEDWQMKWSHILERRYNVINPRRKNWNSELEQTIENPEFSQQVNWELNGLETSDMVLFYFLPNSKSPITLLELGLCTKSDIEILVYCPKEFYRHGNVSILCERYNLRLYDDLNLLEMDLMNQ